MVEKKGELEELFQYEESQDPQVGECLVQEETEEDDVDVDSFRQARSRGVFSVFRKVQGKLWSSKCFRITINGPNEHLWKRLLVLLHFRCRFMHDKRSLCKIRVVCTVRRETHALAMSLRTRTLQL